MGELKKSLLINEKQKEDTIFTKTLKLQKDFDAFVKNQNEKNLYLQNMQIDYCNQLESLESSTDYSSINEENDSTSNISDSIKIGIDNISMCENKNIQQEISKEII